jgi:hypothetical protein
VLHEREHAFGDQRRKLRAHLALGGLHAQQRSPGTERPVRPAHELHDRGFAGSLVHRASGRTALRRELSRIQQQQRKPLTVVRTPSHPLAALDHDHARAWIAGKLAHLLRELVRQHQDPLPRSVRRGGGCADARGAGSSHRPGFARAPDRMHPATHDR